jgi:hypothetical protein
MIPALRHQQRLRTVRSKLSEISVKASRQSPLVPKKKANKTKKTEWNSRDGSQKSNHCSSCSHRGNCRSRSGCSRNRHKLRCNRLSRRCPTSYPRWEGRPQSVGSANLSRWISLSNPRHTMGPGNGSRERRQGTGDLGHSSKSGVALHLGSLW